jgi:hypothetical protein
MDKLNQYRNHIQAVLEKYHRWSAKAHDQEVESQLIIDREHDHYQLLNVGWRDDKEQVFGCTIHVSIKNDRIWIERDFTEYGVASELVDLGVPKEDIVLAFHAPYKRPFTGFAA